MGAAIALAIIAGVGFAWPATAQDAARPNILVIWGDDIGWYNISAYNLGVMGYRTPNIDRIAKEGALFTDWYGQQSCTAGRAAFITGQSPVRTGLTKVGLPGADLGLKVEDPTIAGLLKNHGYMTGQYGKNHLGDLDAHMPTNHGFDEFFRQPLPPERRGGAGEPGLPAGSHLQGTLRAARRDQIDRQPGRQPDDRGHRPADQGANGDGRHRGDRRRARLHRSGSRHR
jgi:arylsulfatase A-like enzyme